MKHATISISDDLDEALAAYGRDRGMSDPLGKVVQEALRRFLAEHGYPVRTANVVPSVSVGQESLRHALAQRRTELPFRPFQITPIEHEGEVDDISIHHDRYFADGELGRSR